MEVIARRFSSFAFLSFQCAGLSLFLPGALRKELDVMCIRPIVEINGDIKLRFPLILVKDYDFHTPKARSFVVVGASNM
jgi:hypothetical protein